MYIFFNIQAVQKCKKCKSSYTYLIHCISSRKVRDKRQQIKIILLCFGGCATKSNSVFISVHFQFCSQQTLVSHSFHSFPFWDDNSVTYCAPFTFIFVLYQIRTSTVLYSELSLTFLNTHTPSCALSVLGNAHICGQKSFLWAGNKH